MTNGSHTRKNNLVLDELKHVTLTFEIDTVLLFFKAR